MIHLYFKIFFNLLYFDFRFKKELKELNISFSIQTGAAAETLPGFIKAKNIGAVVCDFHPLRIQAGWVDDLKKALPADLPIAQIDGHNIVPCWHASDKLEYGARTIRNKINSKLDEFLTGILNL